MKDYICLNINIKTDSEIFYDIIAQELADIGFESFEVENGSLNAYIPSEIYKKNEVDLLLSSFLKKEDKITVKLIPGKNWNEEWEKNYFQPMEIDGKCVIHSTFHKDYPKSEYEIVIDPKMAFGTGHHATTANMVRLILEENFLNKSVIDMGTGTGILAFLAKMKGAAKVSAIEIDESAHQNALENASLNNLDINIIRGDSRELHNLKAADYFFANINRNIIIQDLPEYSKKLKTGGIMLLSGFYEADIPLVIEKAKENNLRPVSYKKEKDWVALKLIKNEI